PALARDVCAVSRTAHRAVVGPVELCDRDRVDRHGPWSDPPTNKYRVVLRVGLTGRRCRLSLRLQSLDAPDALARGRQVARPTLPAVRSQRARAYAQRVVAIASSGFGA